MPIPMKFGGVGVVIGHEITHGFDNFGRTINEYGHSEDWWETLTENEYDRRKQCFITQYNHFLVTLRSGQTSVYVLRKLLGDVSG